MTIWPTWILKIEITSKPGLLVMLRSLDAVYWFYTKANVMLFLINKYLCITRDTTGGHAIKTNGEAIYKN